jgi:LPS O-antigen subunit length determinant protein (WzzB/FepE family)
MRHFNKSIKLIVVTTIIGALAGAAISQFLHPRWVAKMTIQIGQVSTPQSASQLIENQLSAADRYNLPSSRLLVIQDLGLPAPENGSRESNAIFDSLRATPGKGSDLIDLQVSAYSRQQARAAMMTSFTIFSAEHQKKFEPAVDNMERELESASARLATAERDAAHTYESIRATDTQASTSVANSRDILLTNTATLINGQILVLKQQTARLQEVISPLRTYPTRVVGAPYVPDRPSTPSRSLLIAAGAALGLLASAAFIALKNSRRV